MTHFLRAAVFASSFAFATLPAAGQSPWELLDELRSHLQEAGPVTGRFVQTYVPAGFSSGDRESGHMSMWLPDCLRWNYEEPEKKSFLICQGQVWFWNDGESTGRRMEVDAESEPGLDLLLLPSDRLRSRYVSDAERLPDGGWRLRLETPRSAEVHLTARLEIDAERRVLRSLEHTDGEGNLTRFELQGTQPLHHTALFQPPPDMEWIAE